MWKLTTNKHYQTSFLFLLAFFFFCSFSFKLDKRPKNVLLWEEKSRQITKLDRKNHEQPEDTCLCFFFFLLFCCITRFRNHLGNKMLPYPFANKKKKRKSHKGGWLEEKKKKKKSTDGPTFLHIYNYYRSCLLFSPFLIVNIRVNLFWSQSKKIYIFDERMLLLTLLISGCLSGKTLCNEWMLLKPEFDSVGVKSLYIQLSSHNFGHIYSRS